MSAFAVELRRLRKLRVLTQKELAKESRVPLSTISDLERGISQRPHPATVRKLATALGLSGAELAGFQAASRAILPAADRRIPAGVAAARTLPRDVGSFTGREKQLSELLEAVESGVPGGIWVVDGMAGVGKTAFALHAAHRLAERFPDGQLYLELRGHVPGQAPADPADALASLLQTVGVDAREIPQGTQERARLWRDQLTDKRLLLLLDDATDSEQVLSLLPGTRGCLVVVTSRMRLSGLEDVRVISLGTLTPDDAAVLFVRHAARRDLSRDDPAVAEIVRLCGYLPLAVSILAARLRHHDAWTPAWLAADLAAARSRTELMHAENRSVSTAFSLTYRGLATIEQQLFRRLGMYPGTDIDIHAASALNGTSVTATRRLLDALYDRHLIGEPEPGRYRLHDLLREHAGQLAESERSSDRLPVLVRLLDYYLCAIRQASRHLGGPEYPQVRASGSTFEVPPLARPQQELAWLEAERLNLHAAVIAAVSASPAHAASIPVAMNAFLCVGGYWDQARSLCEVAVEAARRTRDGRAQAAAHASLAIIKRSTGDFPQAIASGQRALKLFRAAADLAGEAGVLAHLGRAQYLNSDFPSAKRSLATALGHYGTFGDQVGEADALTHLGYVSYITGDLEAASDNLRRACGLSQAIGDKTREADALTYLGVVQYRTGPYAESTDTLTLALKRYRESGSRNDEAWTLAYLGYPQTMMGALDSAVATLTEALEIFGELGNEYGQATALNHLGLALRLAGDYPGAAARQEESLRLYGLRNSQQGESNALREIGILQMLSGDARASAATHARALEICRKLDDPGGEAESLNNIGDLLLTADTAQARERYEQALLISRSITALLDEGRGLEGIGRCDLRNGEVDHAAMHLRQALAVYQQLGSPNSRRVEALLRECDRR
jgi:tetratricopeptide (TPR) repeat protein/transcriptional regulator with XRE-family HTH domain